VLIRLVVILVLVVLNAFFVAAEFAVVRARRTRLEAMARNGDGLAGLALRAISNISLVLSASQLGVTLCGLGLGWVAEEALVGSLASWVAHLPIAIDVSIRVSVATILALAIVTYVTVVFGELTPKTAALNNPERWARYLVPPLLAFAWLTKPFTWLLNRTSQSIVRAFGQHPLEPSAAVHSPEEIRLLVEQSEEGGALEKEDAALIDAVFEFSEKNAREVMTPRTDIVALDVTATLPEVVETVAESGLSRFPVYEETIDDIIGVLLVKDLIPVLASKDQTFSLRSLIRPPHFVPGSREVEDVLSDFKHRKEHMAIVLDEYGGTAGVVTMEDLLEEIVGEILDEYDEPIDEAIRMTSGETLLPGNTNISELNEEFGTTVPDDDYTTIGGFIFGALGRLPVVGDRVTAGGATFVVHEMEGRRISDLSMLITDATEAPPTDELPSQSTRTSSSPE
jgi:CBS domain containing-hemolysin-like protein